MDARRQTALDALESASSLSELQNSILALRDSFEVEHLIYHSVNSTGQQYAALTYSEAWVQEYLDRDYARVDPVVLGCFRGAAPVDWKELDWSRKSARSFLEESRAFGVATQGYSIPIRGPVGQFAILTLNNSTDDESWARFRTDAGSDALLAAHFINEKALALEHSGESAAMIVLSPREVDALSNLAAGLSRAETADRLKISEHTLRVYIESARFKLGASNTVHAVARALAQGQIVV